jgi:hypothetical protein
VRVEPESEGGREDDAPDKEAGTLHVVAGSRAVDEAEPEDGQRHGVVHTAPPLVGQADDAAPQAQDELCEQHREGEHTDPEVPARVTPHEQSPSFLPQH